MSAPFPHDRARPRGHAVGSLELFLAEHAAGRQSKALESILNSMGDGVVVVDQNRRLLLANPSANEILRAGPNQTDPREWATVYGFFHADGETPFRPEELPLVRAIQGEEVDLLEIFMRHPGAEEGVWLSFTARPLRDESGASRGAVAVFRDISERRHAEQERADLLAREQEARNRAEQVVSLERATEQRLKVVIEASGVLFGSLNMDGVLPAVLELARELISADAHSIWRAVPPDGEWRILCSSGLSAEFERVAVPRASELLLEGPLVVEDVLAAPLLEARRELYVSESIRSLLVVPLRLNGRNSGALTFYSRYRRRFEELDVRTAMALANLAAAAIGTAELYEEQTRMRAVAEAAGRRSAFLAQATAILGSSLDYETTLAQVARLAAPHVADWCSVEVRQPDGSIRQLALAHIDPTKIDLAGDLRRRYPPDPDEPFGVSNVLRTGRSEILYDIPDDLLVRAARNSEHLRSLRDAGLTSYMCVPMAVRDRILGAMTFVSAKSGRHYGPDDLELAEHLGRRAALAIDNALLYETAQRERAAAHASLEASRRSEARFRRLVESGIIGIILGEQDRITEANDVFLRMLGYTREDLAAGGLRWPELTPPEFGEADARARETTVATGACPPFEKEFVRKDGTRVPVLLGAALLELPPRFAWVAFVLDLTDRKRLEERLREAQKLESIGLLAGGVAHDFNNILTGILGNASLAFEDLPEGSPVRSTIDNVVHAAERAADLTRQLLAYSGKGRFVVQPVDISELVRELAPLLRVSIPKKIDLRLDLKDRLPPVEADSSQIQQLIMNLVLNGAEAIGESVGTVLAATRIEEVGPDYVRSPLTHEDFAPGRYVCLEVQDTGSGMDPDTMSHIFDPFFTTKFTGRGLGLAAALGIVRGHKGDIQVWSKPGQGSRFRVLLPVAAHFQGSKPADIATAEELRGTGTVLIADDEDVVLETGQRALQRYGYRVLTARDGQEAVDRFREHSGQVSVILLDMAMPVMSGEEALRHLRAIRPDIPVVVSSGYSELEAVRRFGAGGEVSFIQKPYTGAQLADAIKKALAGKARALGSSEG